MTICALLLPISLHAADSSRLQVSDLLDDEQVGDAQIALDGREVIYTRRWVNQQTDRWESSLCVMDVDGSRQRVLVDGSQPRWSPESDRILFIREGDKTPTIVMTGEQDLRTPMAQSEEYYAALKIAGVKSKLIRFNDQYHGTETHPSNAMRSMLYLMSWYNQYDLKGERDVKILSEELR